ncbi:HAD family hydrolase [Seohaeicola saemankumensis]|uniref:HAD-IIA family hydrolase n=1 Tax=Seohaeicola TaxID=481178 RepID=UPI0035D0E5B7
MHQPIGLDAFLKGDGPSRSAILADLDGCLISGSRVLPFVPELFASCGSRLWIVSNNSTDTAQGLAARLSGMGLPITAERCLLAGEETLQTLARERPGARVALFASLPLHRLAVSLGLVPDQLQPDLVVLARDPSFDFDSLTALIALAHRGLEVWLTNPDPTHPGPDGTPVPETGAIWAALAAAVPSVRTRCLGKPAPDLAERALMRARASPGLAVFIGDTPDTDGAAAKAAGVPFVLMHRPGAQHADLPEQEVQAC